MLRKIPPIALAENVTGGRAYGRGAGRKDSLRLSLPTPRQGQATTWLRGCLDGRYGQAGPSVVRCLLEALRKQKRERCPHRHSLIHSQFCDPLLDGCPASGEGYDLLHTGCRGSSGRGNART
jgi:hypothetical protein